MNIFERAARKSLRINTPQGSLSVEQLFTLNLVQLNDVAIALNKQIKDTEEISFISEAASSNPDLTLRFEIVKHIITSKLADQEVARKRAENKAKRNQLLTLIANKQSEEQAKMSLDELAKELDALDSED